VSVSGIVVKSVILVFWAERVIPPREGGSENCL